MQRINIERLDIADWSEFYRHVGFQFEGVKKNDRWRKDRYLLGKQIS